MRAEPTSASHSLCNFHSLVSVKVAVSGVSLHRSPYHGLEPWLGCRYGICLATRPSYSRTLGKSAIPVPTYMISIFVFVFFFFLPPLRLGYEVRFLGFGFSIWPFPSTSTTYRPRAWSKLLLYFNCFAFFVSIPIILRLNTSTRRGVIS